MYNNHQGGIFTIRGDMCYENKGMTNSALSVTATPETVRLAVPEHTDGESTEKKQRPYKIRVAYIINVAIFIAVGVTLAFIEFDVIPTPKLGYYCRDLTLSHAFNGDTVNNTTLIAGSFLAPLVLLFIIEFRRPNPKNSIKLIWGWYKEMLVGLVSTLMITEVMKAIIGEHRPHFLNTCAPDTEDSCSPGEYIKQYTCTNTHYSFYLVGDSSRSFPSGHTSISFFASIFCAAFLHYRFKVRKLGELAKPFLMLLCLLWGPICGLTRISDRRHHWWDVLAGCVLGIAGAAYTIIALVRKFQVTDKDLRSLSTTTLIDKKNKDSASVII